MTTDRERLHADQKEAKKVGRFAFRMRKIRSVLNEEVLVAASGTVYRMDTGNGVIRRVVPKVKGKAALKAERAERRAAREAS